MEEGREQEKARIANLADQWYSKGPMEPEEILEDPKDKVVGHSSSTLRCEDFELMKTLGTGTAPPRHSSGLFGYKAADGQTKVPQLADEELQVPSHGSGWHGWLVLRSKMRTRSLRSRYCAKLTVRLTS